MSRYDDICVGDTFGFLEVLGLEEQTDTKATPPSKRRYKCRCGFNGCNNVKSVLAYNLLSGSTTSCGCARNFNKRKTNPIEYCGDYIKIFFFNDPTAYALVDKDAYPHVKDYCWRLKKVFNSVELFYAQATTRKQKKDQINIYMHQILMPKIDGFVIDHIDGNGLNNSFVNLRYATLSQNSMNQKIRSDNSSGHKGVCWVKSKNKWLAKISVNGKQMNLGLFDTIEEAVSVRLKKEEEVFNEFSYLKRI